MATQSHMNVYKGPDAMKRYFDPDFQPPLPLVELPDILNPFREDGVRIYAKMMTALPCQNVKALPALNMLQNAGPLARNTIVEPSSGSTVTSMSMISRVLHGNTDVHAYVSNKTEESRLRTLQFFGLKVVLYGGPAQPEISDPRGQIQKLKRMGEESEDIYNPGQYENKHNPESHMRWTGPQLLTQLPEINIFAAGMGSAGCITGTGTYLKSKKPAVTVIGVCNKVSDSIPGPRPFPLFDKISFPWKEVTDAIKEINSIDSYRLSMAMSREGLICGPSSGMALKGLLEFIEDNKLSGELKKYADPSTGEVSCVFLCCDLPYQYMDTYFQKLGEHDFNPISNLHLKDIDQGTYDSHWELTVSEAVTLNHGKPCEYSQLGADVADTHTSAVTVIDLRQQDDFARSHVTCSLNLPIRSSEIDRPSPFDDIGVLEAQFRDLESAIDGLYLSDQPPRHGPVLVLCYSGETSRLACSIMRQKSIEAYSLRGGFQQLPTSDACQTRPLEMKL